jgi:Carboxypeptidase regulatory-like domain
VTLSGVESFHMSRLFLAFVLIAPISLRASADTGIKGAVKDETGAAIGDATVFVPTTSIRSTHTDRDGTFSVALASDGLYDVFVSAPGFTPTCAKLQVRQHQWAIFRPTLKLDPLTVKLYWARYERCYCRGFRTLDHGSDWASLGSDGEAVHKRRQFVQGE